jgi:hypothetical protein
MIRNKEAMITKKCGPSGGTGGEEFTDDIPPEVDQVVEVRIYAQQQVHAVQIVHKTADGRHQPFPVHGSITGKPHVLRLAADEFIVGIRGRFGAQVDSICIITNKQVSPLFGGEGGNGAYIYEASPGSEIVGFYGRAGDSLNAIGVILRRRGL